MMQLVYAIDDTDIIGTPGTGHLAMDLVEEIHRRKLGDCSAISRHQLFVHEDVPFTSHNSSMCFEIACKKERYDDLIQLGIEFLLEKSVEGADPGLCVAIKNSELNADRLIEYGNNAKRMVLSKPIAYNLADELGVHLSEHGGTGMGIVGALAAVGLRLGGNDGRFRGWHGLGIKGDKFSVKQLKAQDYIDTVRVENGAELGDNTTIRLSEDRLKLVYMNHQSTVLALKTDDLDSTGQPIYETLIKTEIKKY